MTQNSKTTNQIRIALLYIGVLTLLSNTSFSQELNVLYGTSLNINSGTPFSVSGLVLTPAADFTLNNISISKNLKATNYLGHSTITRVYTFSHTSNPFTGVAGIQYQAQELSSGNYANLKMELHNGNHWLALPLSTNDVSAHTTQSHQFSQSLNEITLTDNLFPPSLTILGNPVSNGVLKFAINTASEVRFYSFNGLLLWSKQYVAGTYTVQVPNLASGTYLLKANQLSQTVLIIK